MEFPYLCLTAAMETETGRRVLKQYLMQLGYATKSATDSAVSEQIKPYFDAFKVLRNSLRDTTRNLSALVDRVSAVDDNLMGRVDELRSSIVEHAEKLYILMDGDRMEVINHILRDVGQLKGSINENTEKLSNLDANLKEFEGSIHENTQHIIGRLQEHTNKLSNHTGDIDTLGTHYDTLATRYKEMYAMYETAFTHMKSALEGHRTRLDTIEKSLELVMSLPAFSTGGATVSVEEEEKL